MGTLAGILRCIRLIYVSVTLSFFFKGQVVWAQFRAVGSFSMVVLVLVGGVGGGEGAEGESKCRPPRKTNKNSG